MTAAEERTANRLLDIVQSTEAPTYAVDEHALEQALSRLRAQQAVAAELGTTSGPVVAWILGMRLNAAVADAQGMPDAAKLDAVRSVPAPAGLDPLQGTGVMVLRKLAWTDAQIIDSLLRDGGRALMAALREYENERQRQAEETRARLERGSMVAAYLEVMADRGADGSRRIEAAAELEKLAPGRFAVEIGAMREALETTRAAYAASIARQEQIGREHAAEKSAAREERNRRLLELGSYEPHEVHAFTGAGQ